MSNKNILKSIFASYFIDKVLMIEETDTINFIIYSMNKSISLDRWENLENLLADFFKKNINLWTHPHATRYLDASYLNKGVTIE